MTSYRTEFPDFPATDYPAFPHPSFEDSSWHNDECPSMRSEALEIHIWINYAAAEQRGEDLPGARYFAQFCPEASGVEGDNISTDSWDDVVAFLAQHGA